MSDRRRDGLRRAVLPRRAVGLAVGLAAALALSNANCTAAAWATLCLRASFLICAAVFFRQCCLIVFWVAVHVTILFENHTI